MASRSRGWCFTLNNPLLEDDEKVTQLECRYIVYGNEKSESGTQHLQGYVEFANAKTLGGVKKLLEKAHWEVRKGSPEQASQYCKKDGQFVERGEIPKQGKRTDLEEVVAEVRGGATLKQIAEEYGPVFVKYQRGLAALKSIQYTDRTGPPEVVWLWGKSGTGKTRTAVEKSASFYIKDGTKWWDGYEQQSVIIIDDFDGAWPFRDLLRLLDRYPYRGQTKGGYISINSPTIFITCEFDPSHYWSSTQLTQIERRLTSCTEVVHRSGG